MNLMKRLERELILEWQSLQAATTAEKKSAGLKAYYIKLANYRRARSWSLELISPKRELLVGNSF